MTADAFARVLFICMIQFFYAPAANAVIFWNEDWESGPGNWPASSCPTPPLQNPSISTDQSFSPTHSLKHVFTGHAGVDPGAGGCFHDRNHPWTEDVWYRWYEYWEPGFEVDYIGSKVIKPGDNRASHWWNYMWGSRQMSFSAQGVFDAVPPWDTTNYYQNVNAFSQPDGQWVCYEWHIKYNTPGVADGVLEGWANGLQIVNYTGTQWRGTSTTDPLPSNAGFDYVRVYVQHGRGTIYRDDIAVGTERIGCEPIPNCDAVNIAGQALPSCPLDDNVDMRLNTDEPAAVGNTIQNIINGP